MQGSIGQLGKISIHALREEGDVMPFADHLRLINFYPRPPRGGRPDESATEELIRAISIHALREEGDKDDRLSGNPNQIFLSTPSARRATVTAGVVLLHLQISIHALREEGDGFNAAFGFPVIAFLSTPSARRATCENLTRKAREGRFLSTPSARRATCSSLTSRRSTTISIHALREEGDVKNRFSSSLFGYFYPRPPRGGRPIFTDLELFGQAISIHALREEGDTGFFRGATP